jgi:hypothetical protein
VNARFVEKTGHIVFVRDSALWAVPFDLDAQITVGLEIKIVDSLQTNGILGSAAYAFSDQGRFVYLKGGDVSVPSTELKLYVLNREGERVSTLDTQGRIGQLNLSPDGSNLSFTKFQNAETDIWVYNLHQSTSGRRTFDGDSTRAVWADSSTLFYSSFSETSGNSGIWKVAGDGSSAPSLLTELGDEFSGTRHLTVSVSIAAEKLFYNLAGMGGAQVSTWSIDLSEAEELTVAEVDVTPNSEDVWWSRLQVSPNGKWVAYVSNESGSSQVYVRPYPEISKGKFQISALDAESPIWSEDGKEIFFRSGSSFFSARYEEIFTDSRAFIDFDEPELLFKHSIVENHLTFPAYVYNASSETFIILSTADAAEPVFQQDSYLGQTTLTVIENWFSELESLSPRVE